MTALTKLLALVRGLRARAAPLLGIALQPARPAAAAGSRCYLWGGGIAGP